MDALSVPRRGFMAGLASLGAFPLAGCDAQPPTYGSLLRTADLITYNAQRLIIPRATLVREFDVSDISSFPAIGTTDPGNPHRSDYNEEQGPIYEQARKTGFADWRLRVEGAVAQPVDLSLADLRRLPRRTQITRHICEEGWSAIGQWTGVPLHAILRLVGASPDARYAYFYSYDKLADCIDMVDAFHPQTILAYGFNGSDLPIAHGAPLRLRLERQVGYRSMKFIRKIVVTEHFDDFRRKGWVRGWSWYAGI